MKSQETNREQNVKEKEDKIPDQKWLARRFNEPDERAGRLLSGSTSCYSLPLFGQRGSQFCQDSNQVRLNNIAMD